MITTCLNPLEQIISAVHVKNDIMPFAWGNHLEIVWQIDGIVISENAAGQIDVPEKGLLVNNPRTVNRINAAVGEAVIFHINFDNLSPSLSAKLPPRFFCIADRSEPGIKRIQELLANLLTTRANDFRQYDLYCESILTTLLFELAVNFGSDETERKSMPSSMIGRLESMLQYITDHHQERLSLQSIADLFFLSPQYIARTFRELLGLSYIEFLTDFRLSLTLPLLEQSRLSLEKITEKSGFASTRSYADAFRRKYQMLPSAYRKRHRQGHPRQQPSPHADADPTASPCLARAIKQALTESSSAPSTKSSVSVQSLVQSVDVAGKGQPMGRGFQKIISLHRAKDLVFSSTQNLLREAQREIGFEQVKFHGLLDDSMKVCVQYESGRITYNFGTVDSVFDFLLTLNLKPIIELSYLPRALASANAVNASISASICGMPRSIRDWNLLVKELVSHLRDRYGEKTVREWPFSIWSQPDNLKSPFGFVDKTDYFELYANSYQVIKQIDPDFQVGTPSLMAETLLNSAWFDDYYEFCVKNQCMPDFVNFNLYTIRVSKNTRMLVGDSSFRLTDNPDAVKNILTNITRWNIGKRWNFKKYNITEWCYFLGHDLLADTMYQAVYHVKNVVDNFPGKFNFARWTLSDFSDEYIAPEETFHGGMGLFTKNEIRKPIFYACQILSKMGTVFIDKGDGFLVTRSDKGIQIMLYYYQHYSNEYIEKRKQDHFLANRYQAFNFDKALHVHLRVNNLDAREYLMTETVLNRKHGSSFDQWTQSGGMPLATPEEVNYIKAVSIPFIHKETIAAAGGNYQLRRQLEPLEIRLIELAPR